jgi:hypothetical protein
MDSFGPTRFFSHDGISGPLGLKLTSATQRLPGVVDDKALCS